MSEYKFKTKLKVKKYQVGGYIIPKFLEGRAIYLHYPNFWGSTDNAIKIGNFDG